MEEDEESEDEGEQDLIGACQWCCITRSTGGSVLTSPINSLMCVIYFFFHSSRTQPWQSHPQPATMSSCFNSFFKWFIMLIAAGNIHTQSVGRKDFKARVLNRRTASLKQRQPPLRGESNADLSGSACSLQREVMTCTTCECPPPPHLPASNRVIYMSGNVALWHWPVWFQSTATKEKKYAQILWELFWRLNTGGWFSNVNPQSKTTQE